MVPLAVRIPTNRGYADPRGFSFSGDLMYKRVAVLIDGGFFRKRYPEVYGSLPALPSELAKKLYGMAMSHAGGLADLYRIFYYDCPPLSKKAHNPVTGKAIDFSKSAQAIYMNSYIEELKKKRKMALRLGHVRDFGEWTIRPRYTKDIVRGNLDPKLLKENDVVYDMKQKGVDMKIGVDIATLALKKLVGKIILIAGDADFVPAAKLARREGIDFVLDPMWCHIHPDLHEHIDGLESKCPKPKTKP
jgi:uncharacterized LabA/DUF88 family protein